MPIAPQEQAPAAPTVDTATIVDSVMGEINARADRQTAEVVDEVMAQINTLLEERLAAIDPAAVAAVVEAEVAEQLAQQPQVVPAAHSEALEGLAQSAGIQQELTNLYRRTNPAVVFIIVPPAVSGSGFVYDAQGHIVTNNHVVENGQSYEVVFASGDRRAAELVGNDADSDLAVLKVEELPEGVLPLTIAEPGSLQVGEFVVAIGNPFGEQGSMSLGIVSGLGRSLRSQRGLRTGSSYSLPQVVQTDAPINPGNSGGPLLSLDGEVVGVNSAIASVTGVNSGVGFAIPAIAIRRIVPKLIEMGSYPYAYMGIGFEDELSLGEQAAFGLPQTRGAYVISVSPGSPAEEAGLIAADPATGRGGDLVVKIDDQPIDDFSDLNGYLVFSTTVGQTIEVTVLRNGEEIVVPLTLDERP